MDKTVTAVFSPDLRGTLQEAGLLEPLLAGKLKCGQCNRVLTIDSFGGMAPSADGHYGHFWCTHMVCHKGAHAEMRRSE